MLLLICNTLCSLSFKKNFKTLQTLKILNILKMLKILKTFSKVQKQKKHIRRFEQYKEVVLFGEDNNICRFQNYKFYIQHLQNLLNLMD